MYKRQILDRRIAGDTGYAVRLLSDRDFCKEQLEAMISGTTVSRGLPMTMLDISGGRALELLREACLLYTSSMEEITKSGGNSKIIQGINKDRL